MPNAQMERAEMSRWRRCDWAHTLKYETTSELRRRLVMTNAAIVQMLKVDAKKQALSVGQSATLPEWRARARPQAGAR